MPVGYYIIPMVDPPWSRTNPQRPQYVDELQTNWTGHNVDAFGVYICKVNTTEPKHTQLASMPGVRQLPREYTWDTPIADLKVAQRNVLSNWCAGRGIPFDETETLGQFLQRVLSSGLFDLGNTPLASRFADLPQARRDKVVALCQKHGIAVTETDTVKQITERCGSKFWPGNQLYVSEF